MQNKGPSFDNESEPNPSIEHQSLNDGLRLWPLHTDERLKTLTIMLRSAQENEALLIKECDFAKNRICETETELKAIKEEKEEILTGVFCSTILQQLF